jgi:hypothetical protein
MSQSSADLIIGWKAERSTLARKIAILQHSDTSLTPGEMEAAIRNMSDLMAEYDGLIAEFSRHEPIPIIFDAAQIGEAEPIIRFRFAHGGLQDGKPVS